MSERWSETADERRAGEAAYLRFLEEAGSESLVPASAANGVVESSDEDEPDTLRKAGDNCGTGAGGFQPGNTCGAGGGDKFTLASGDMGVYEEASSKDRPWSPMSAGTLRHGTRADIREFGKDEPVYLTVKVTEAAGYAAGLHLGGKGKGRPRVYEVRTKPGRAADINGAINQAVSEDYGIEEAIDAATAAAKRDGFRYVVFDHPSFSGEDDQFVVISLHPSEDLTVVGKRTLGKAGDNCGTGAGGFQPGNTCGAGGGGGAEAWTPDNAEDLHADLDLAASAEEVGKILKHYGTEKPARIGSVKNEDVYLTRDGYVVEWDGKDAYPSVTEAAEWVSNQDPTDFYPDYEENFSKEFWDSPSEVYHATDAENVESIMRDGLKAGGGSGITNTNLVGVFATTSLDQAEYGTYGDTVIAIDTAAMKRDGFTPTVSQEPDIVSYELYGALANSIGLDDYEPPYEGNGQDGETAVIGGSIPAKYLRVEAKK